MALVKLFGENDTVFTSDGDKQIKAHKALVHPVVNGDFYLDLEVYNDDLQYLTDKGIVAVKCKDGTWQGFRLGYSELQVDYTYFKCWHVSYDMEDYLIKDLNLDNTAYNTAVSKIKSGTTRVNPFTFTTSISTIVNLNIHNASLYDSVFALINATNTYIVRDNYNISLVSSLGSDKGITVETGKNLTALDRFEDVSNLVNELYPSVIFNDKEYTVAGDYIYDYSVFSHKYTKHVEFEQYRPEYYSGLYSQYSSLVDTCDSLQTQIDNDSVAITQLRADKATNEANLATMRQDLASFETEVRDKLSNSTERRSQIYEKINSALHVALDVGVRNLDSINGQIASKNAALLQLQAQYEIQINTVNENNEKCISIKDAAGQAGYKEQSIVASKQAVSIKKQISAIEASIRKLETSQRNYQSKVDKISEYLTDLYSFEVLSTYDITSIVKCLKGYGITFVGDIAKEYADVTETIEDKDEYVREIESKYSDIKELKDKIDDMAVQIDSLSKAVSFNGISKNTAQTNADTILATIESAIRSDLLMQATAHLDKYKYPQITYEVKCLPIDADLGDTVQVLYSTLGVDITTHVLSMDYDCISETVDSLQFGNTAFTIVDMLQQINSQQNQAMANSLVLLQNAYSNLMSKSNDISGYVAGITTESIVDGTLAELDSRMEINQGSVGLRVTESQLGKVTDAKIEVAKGQIENTVSNTLIPNAITNLGAYSLTVTADTGTTYDDNNMSKTLIAKVVNKDTDITTDLPTRAFSWTRKSLNTTADAIWNKTARYGKTLSITSADYNDNCSFICDVYINDIVNLTDTTGTVINDTTGSPITTLVPRLVLRVELPLQASFKQVKSTILQLSDKILLQIDSNGKLTSINMETGETSSIQLTADQINLNGYTSINGSFNVDAYGNLTIDSRDVSSLPNGGLYINGDTIMLSRGDTSGKLEITFYEELDQYGKIVMMPEIVFDNDGWTRIAKDAVYSYSFVNVSDKRKKEDFTEFDCRYYNLAEKLHFMLFRYKSTPNSGFGCGLIAQDVQAIMNELKISPDEFGAISIDAKGYLYVDYTIIYALMSWYMQEKTKKMENRIKALEERLGD